ncbi:hypothetical protein RCH18_001108 [Flavobacterium sp. PL11]|uniref:ion channel n=1 Tax=Flavobacterium sp. PL11 TaxID=3071717 RepID=UPI002E01B55B|nr:hypothetical protein [Flavobacterium sp. PL11]
MNQWQHHDWIIWILIYLFLETLFYNPTLIFASDKFGKPRSYKRSMLLLFFNYIEIAFEFATFYSVGNYLNKEFTHWFDPIYFSIVTSSSIGYGDLYPVNPIGKFLVTTQFLTIFIFCCPFFEFFLYKN